jgi:hypothetical protein
MQIFLILLTCFLLFLIIKPLFKKKEKKEHESGLVDFDKKELKRAAETFEIEFIEQKDKSLKAIKIINTLQFGLIEVVFFRGSIYSDKGLTFAQFNDANGSKKKLIFYLDDLTNNDIILILTFLNKL